MSRIDPQAEIPLVNWGDVGASEVLPAGTVTLLLADVEGSTRLWETQPEEMAGALARLDRAVSEAIAAHDGARPLEQGEGDSFVAGFARASDAVACALHLQRSPLAPIRLRIGLHTGEVRLRDDGNYAGPTINRTARLRDLAHGGQTVLSGATEDMVLDHLPEGAWLTDLGTHRLRDLPRPERVVQLCHPELCNEFPPLRVTSAVVSALPVQLTTFVGRQAELANLRTALTESRMITLTGAGGVGKTRLAVEVCAELAGEFGDGVCYVDLAPIAVPELVPVATARTLGLPDQPGRSTIETLQRFLGQRHMLVVLDNCEHLLSASATLAVAVLEAAPRVTLLATSREPLGVTGEATWQLPSLSLADEALELFADRARLARSDFRIAEADIPAAAEICRRLDGIPLAIELAAARVRALSLTEIVGSLHDRFRLLTGGSRTAVRRQQTLRASVDWSHALLTDTERILFRRLAVFLGGFNLEAARAIAGTDGIERYQVLDQLSLLVDKSLVVAENDGDRTRYRLLETVRQYALEKLGESGEADAVHTRHRDYYTEQAALLDAPARTDYEQRIGQAERDMDNLRAALGWSLENSDIQAASTLASSLQPLWLTRGRIREGLAWFDTVLGAAGPHPEVTPAVHAQVLADRSLLGTSSGIGHSAEQAQRALAGAREIGDPALLARALIACAYSTVFNADAAQPYFDEAAELARSSGDLWRLSHILGWQGNAAIVAGDPVTARAAAEEGLGIAEAIGDRLDSRQCRYCLGTAQQFQGELAAAGAQFDAVIADADDAHDIMRKALGVGQKAYVLAYQGETTAARIAAEAALTVGAELGEGFTGFAYLAAAVAALAAGDALAAQEASEKARRHLSYSPGLFAVHGAYYARAALATGDLLEARRRSDDAATAPGWYLMVGLTTRAQVALAQGDHGQAESDAYEALAQCSALKAYIGLPDILECLAAQAVPTGRYREATRLCGAAHAARQRMGAARFQVDEARYQESIAALRAALGDTAFDEAWTAGTQLSIDEAIAYAQRGRGERKRPSAGWASLTPTELDVVRLVAEGLSNSEIGARLFVSPRTAQTHLTHVYTKLGLTSRVQLAQQATRQLSAAD
ncbi:MAG: LuxR family transcriptional regulator [Mycolicibacter sinensis]